MPRQYARILTNVWDNDEFVNGTTPDAKLLFVHLFSRRDLSFAGHLVVREHLWAQKVFNSDLQRLNKALVELELLRYVIIDATSGELLIRTFIRHDGAYRNPKMVSAIKSALTEMDSDTLRSVACGELTACLQGTKPEPPPNGEKHQQDRRSDQQSDHQPDYQSDPQWEDQWDQEPDHNYSLQPTSFSLHPSSNTPHPNKSLNNYTDRAKRIAERAGELHGKTQVANGDGRDRFALAKHMTQKLLRTEQETLEEFAGRDDLDEYTLARHLLDGRPLPELAQPDETPTETDREPGAYRAILAKVLNHPDRFLKDEESA